jgi:hypothetical protein
MPPWCPNCCHFGVNGFGDAQETSRRLYWRWRPATDRPPRRRTAMTRTRIALLPGLLLTLALAVAACGGGAGKSDGVASLGGADSATSTTAAGGGDDRQKALDWARCMRQHGINLPDPQITANGIAQPLPEGMDRDDPRLRAPRQACRQYLPDNLTEESGG